MKVLLLHDDKKLGKKGAIITVADGYATSALIPMGKATPATPQIIAQVERASHDAAHQARQQQKELRDHAQTLHGKKVTITAKAEGGKIFGSIGSRDIAEAIKKEYNIPIKNNAVQVDHIKELGEQDVTIDFGQKISAQIVVEIVQA